LIDRHRVARRRTAPGLVLVASPRIRWLLGTGEPLDRRYLLDLVAADVGLMASSNGRRR